MTGAVDTGPDARASLYGTRQAVVTGHHLATQQAWRVLDEGGLVVDAMIAASAVLAVALPHATSLGGCGMALIRDGASGRTMALDGSGRAPRAATPERFATQIDARGPRSWLVPGLVALWQAAHARFGRRPWHGLFDAAIALARDGVPCASELARNLRLCAPSLAAQPGFAALFHDASGQPLRAGMVMRQPALADTLEDVARQGWEGFYAGRAARALVEFSSATGGLLEAGDLAPAQADWAEPVHGEFGHGWSATVMPPNSVGVLMLAQLADLVDLAGQGDTPAADPADWQVRQILAARRQLMALQDEVANPARRWPVPVCANRDGEDPGDTAGIVIVDHAGNAVSMLQSVFQPFGSGCVDPGSGILLNNRLSEFSLEPAAHNRLAPGRRPVHTLNPYLVFRDGRLALAAASPGGISQTTTGVQLVCNACLRDLPLSAAIDAPRWSLTRDGGFLAEPGVPAMLAGRLRAHGIALQADTPHPFYYGSVKAIRCGPDGVLEAAADLRRQATAMAG
ncbi:hypothetical protein N234_36970 [Ralstonia pickettii DTP0602]|nr:hypothetical protein N234_36970 [Ralstonia pickettii DTP0602]